MTHCANHPSDRGLTLIELLCVMAIILILTTLILGPAMRVLQKVQADDWADKAMTDLQLTVTQLHAHFRGRVDFPEVTLDAIESMRLVQSAQLRFLKDSQVTFIPFDGSDLDEQVVIKVRLRLARLGEIPSSAGPDSLVSPGFWAIHPPIIQHLRQPRPGDLTESGASDRTGIPGKKFSSLCSTAEPKQWR